MSKIWKSEMMISGIGKIDEVIMTNKMYIIYKSLTITAK